jgi:hypothetical protein
VRYFTDRRYLVDGCHLLSEAIVWSQSIRPEVKARMLLLVSEAVTMIAYDYLDGFTYRQVSVRFRGVS